MLYSRFLQRVFNVFELSFANHFILYGIGSGRATIVYTEVYRINYVYTIIGWCSISIKDFQCMREGFGQTLPHQCSDFIGRHAIVRALSLPCAYAEVEVVLISRTAVIVIIIAIRGYVFRMILFYPIRNGLIECRYFSIIFSTGRLMRMLGEYNHSVPL